ncbi:hypothetical protein [Edaphobacter aggregans]|uniref:hypothetical protein n=1 Tax=Edaphobacter aggregans TaxID=570835 RepID=UPI000F740BB7|nr:hypothetical protein [Edaphobacter aggregans]
MKFKLRPSLVLTVLLVGLCQTIFAQDFDLAAPGAVPPPTLATGGAATLFQNVRIFDGNKCHALSSLQRAG